MKRNEKIPIRPINITKIITSLLPVLKSEVIPIEKPVVPNAEHTSKRIGIKPIEGSSTAMVMTAAEQIMMAVVITI